MTNAVKVTGVIDRRPTWVELETLSLVTVRLVGLDTSVVIEVWNTSQEMPVLQKPDDDTKGGRGLLLVEETTKDWGSYRTPRGKLGPEEHPCQIVR